MSVNWGLGVAPDVGGTFMNAFNQGQQQHRQEQAKNALAAYAMNPNDETLKAVAQYDPQTAIQERSRMAGQQDEAHKRALAQVELVGKLATGVKAGRIPYAQAIRFAQSQGLDISAVPAENDPGLPAWLDEQIGMAQVFSDPQKIQDYTTLAQNVMLRLSPEHRDIRDPVFIDAMNKAWEVENSKTIPLEPGGSAITYNAATGKTSPLIVPNQGGQAAGAPVAGSIPQSAADYLRKNPHLRGEFDAKYGAGSAASILGGGSGNATGGFRP